MANLSEWLKDAGETQAAFAKRIGSTQAFVSRLCMSGPGAKFPSLEVAKRIEKATGGAVAVLDWPNLAKRARAFHAISRGREADGPQGADAA